MSYVQVPAGSCPYVAGRRPRRTHANRHADGPVGSNLFFEQGRVDAILQGYQQATVCKMGHDCHQSMRRVIRAHCDEADIELAFDLVRESDGDSYVEGTIRHVYLQSRLANSDYVLLIDVNERHIV